jgi:hypothetical protein
MGTGGYESDVPRAGTSWATVLSGIGLGVATIAGAMSLVSHGNLPWPEGAFQDPDVLVPVIALLMSFLAAFVLGEVLRLAPRDVRVEDD